MYLKPGDEVAVSITGLGTLRNRIASYSSINPTVEYAANSTSFVASNTERTVDSSTLTLINNKLLNYEFAGYREGPPIVFVHGLGGSTEYWTPLLLAAGLEKSHSLHLFDLEGHGLSPTSSLSVLSIESFVADLKGVFDHANIQARAIVIANSMSCLIATQFALTHPTLVSKLILVGPPPNPLPESTSGEYSKRANIARTKGMRAFFDETAIRSRLSNPVAYTAVRLSLLCQDPEGYAKACTAFAEAPKILDLSRLEARTLIVTGSNDVISSQIQYEALGKQIPNSVGVKILDNVRDWHVFDDARGVEQAVSPFLHDLYSGLPP